jgi:hypothetical protein
MLALMALLCVAPDDLALRIHHLDSVAQAWSPAPSTDGTRVAFLTTLFGTRQAASMAADGSYPTQLTDEPEGVRAVRWVPGPAKELLVLAMRSGHHRLLIVDEQGDAPVEVDGPGDQLWGGFSRDGKRLYYATVDGGKATLRAYALDTHKMAELSPPPPAAKAVIPKDTVPLEDAMKGLISLGPISPDQRSLLATSKRGDGEVVYSIDLGSTRAMKLTPEPGRYRLPHYTPDNKNIYVWTDQGRQKAGVDLLTIANRTRKTMYVPAAGELSAFAVSDDGHRLVVAVESGGETLFSLLDLPSLRPQPLAAPPSGALAKSDASEPPILWDRTSERLFFGWRLANDTTDIWELRLGYGQALRLTRSPRPGLPRDAIPRATLVKVPSGVAWMWMPEGVTKPKVAVLASAHEVQPVFDKRVAALNFAGFAVFAVQGPDAQKVALDYLRTATEVDGREPLLLDFDGEGVQEQSRWSGVVGPKGAKGVGLTLDADQPDLRALVKYALRNGRAGE